MSKTLNTHDTTADTIGQPKDKVHLYFIWDSWHLNNWWWVHSTAETNIHFDYLYWSSYTHKATRQDNLLFSTNDHVAFESENIK
jgi:hypothetical protein